MSVRSRHRTQVVALSGGIGGAKLALGLSRIMVPDQLTVVANTGDDFEHLGLAISPDIDTLMYTLAGVDNPATGWGRKDETWTFMRVLEQIGGETWFKLGDGDLALHVERTRRLRAGDTLSDVTADVCGALGIGARILPMSDEPVRTRVRTEAGWLDFQHYFVREQCRPVVREIAFEGASRAKPHSEFMSSLSDPATRAVVICPSNPLISIEPIQALPGVRAALAACPAPVVAVSPIIAGQAVKGPTAKMLKELGVEPSAAAIARRYADIIDVLVVEAEDAPALAELGLDIEIHAAKTLMTTLADREHLAHVVLDVADRLASTVAPRSSEAS